MKLPVKTAQLFLMLSFLQVSSAGTINGIVKYESGQSSSALITIVGTNLGAVPGVSGYYEIENVPIGKWKIQFYELGAVTIEDSVIVKSDTNVIELNMTMKLPVIESTQEMEEYHRRLSIFEKANSLLSIKLDSISIDGKEIRAYSTFTNTSPFPIFILRTIDCIEPLDAIITNDKGVLMRNKARITDCVGEKIMPDSTDEVEIRPLQKLIYDPVHFWTGSLSYLPEGKYTIRLLYQYEKPNALCCYGFNADYRERYATNIKTMTKVLRGKYLSSNTLTFVKK